MMFRLNMRLTVSFLLLFLFFGYFCFFVFPVYSQEQITEIYSPSSTTTIVSGWNNPTNVYSSDDNRAYSSTDEAEQEYSGYDINIPSEATIKGVYVGVEGYTTDASNEELFVYLWDGNVWYGVTAHDYSGETLQWLNFTSVTSWTPEKVNSIKTKIEYNIITQGGGCYSNRTFFVVVDETDGTFENTSWNILPVSELKVGMTLLVWDDERKTLTFDNVSAIDVHEGTWQLYDIYSGELDLPITIVYKNKTITEWKSHVELTGNHPLLVYRNATQSWEIMNASTVYELWSNGETLCISHLWYNYSLKLFPIWNITVRTFNGKVYNLHGSKPSIYFFGKTYNPDEEILVEVIKAMIEEYGKQPPWMIIAGKQTYYVDWLPVKIVYTLPSARQWNTVAFWQFDMATRSWNQVSLWNFSVITKGWKQVSAWMFDLASRSWKTISTWNFSLVSRGWKTVSVWIADLACRTWNTVAEWASSLVGKAWHCIDYWFGELGVEKPFPFVALVGAVLVVGIGAFIMFRREFI